MNKLIVWAAAGVAAAGGAVCAAPSFSWPATYVGRLDGARGRLTIRAVTGGRLAIDLAEHGPNCVGGVSGIAAQNASGGLTLRQRIQPDWDLCEVTISRRADQITIRSKTCGDYHGAQCAFDGTLRRTP